MKKFFDNNKKIIDSVSIFVSIIIIALCVLPTIIVSSYSVLFADDFANAYNIGFESSNLWEYILASFRFCKEIYLTWQGTYFSLFIQALLSPINNYGTLQLRIIMVFNSILFFGALLFFTWSIVKSFKNEKCIKWTLIIYVCLVYMVTSYEDYSEIFFWYTGAVSYTIPLSLLILALGTIVLYQQKKEKKYFIAAVILGIMAMGGNLMIAGMGCYICLLFCFLAYLKSRKIDKYNVSLLGIWVIGALLNVASPGNFVRQAVIDDTGCHPVMALKLTAVEYIEHLYWYRDNTDIISVFGIVLLLGIICGEIDKIDMKYILVSALGVFLPFVTAFPVILGYNGGALPERCGFMIQLAIILSFTNIFFIMGNCFRKKIKKERNRTMCSLLLSLGIIALMCVDNFEVPKSIALNHWKGLEEGIYKEYHKECEELYNSLKNREGEDVVIKEKDVPERISNFCYTDISNNSNHWTNIAISNCYGLSSISISLEE